MCSELIIRLLCRKNGCTSIALSMVFTHRAFFVQAEPSVRRWMVEKDLTSIRFSPILIRSKALMGKSGAVSVQRGQLQPVHTGCAVRLLRRMRRKAAPEPRREISGGVPPALRAESGPAVRRAIWVVPRSLRPIAGRGLFACRRKRKERMRP